MTDVSPPTRTFKKKSAMTPRPPIYGPKNIKINSPLPKFCKKVKKPLPLKNWVKESKILTIRPPPLKKKLRNFV